MGSQQFASGMTDVDKAQLDRIETNVANVSWWDKYETLSIEGFSALAGGQTIEVVNIAGAGYLSKAISKIFNSGIRIFVDGAKIHDSYYGSSTFSDCVGGIVQLSDYIVSGASVRIPNNNGTTSQTGLANKNHPYIAPMGNGVSSTEWVVIPLSKPIFFNNSLKVEIYGRVATTPGSIPFHFQGGRKL